MQKHLLVVAGPTAVGKTCLSIKLAQRLDTSILSCDSRQFFKEMNVGTAKPCMRELSAVPHLFINHLSITDNYTVGDYEKDALKVLQDLFEQKKVVLMTGGSGLYVKAVCNGLDNFPAIAKEIRADIIAKFEQNGLSFLQELLKRLDPQYYAEVDLNNPQRLIRALEICVGTGKSYSSFRTSPRANRPFNIIKVGLRLDRCELYERINQRVDAMMKDGLLEEAKKLYPFRHLNALQTVGYKELFEYFDGLHDLEKAVELIKRNTRRYAKRQMTWFCKDPNISWFHPLDVGNILTFVSERIGMEK
ncbi:MAG: tRNA (adenosine(37)-N6)-dimethylallyltransferase MiaA [Chitinophagales bacterium]